MKPFAMRSEPSPSTVGRWATDLDALRPSAVGFALPVSIAQHLSLWRLIAEGSSLVYEGFDRRMGARVAVKLLAARDNVNAHTRLMREAALYANLDHPSVPRLHDVATLSDGTPYVVMEFVAGQTLAELLAQGALEPSLACDIASQVLGSLAVLHRAGIVHRDIKPTNIILEPGGDGHRQARLVDLGVAKASVFDAAPEKLTQPGALLGTPQYMAPEQFAGAEADARTDLYAVGLVLVEMLTGSCPHSSRSFADLIAARMRDELDEAGLVRAGIGQGMTAFLRSALARDPEARFASAEDMQCELHAARADESCLWMQRAARRSSPDSVQPVGPIATLPPAASPSAARMVESSVWGVLPDPPGYDDEVRRPPTRSGVKALLLGFGLTFGVGGVLVMRAQTRDAAELPAPVQALNSTASTAASSPSLAEGTASPAVSAAPLAAPASAGGGESSSLGAPRPEQALGSGSLLGGIPSSELRPPAEDSVTSQLSRAAAQRAPVQQPAVARPSPRRRATVERSNPRYWEPPPRDSAPLREESQEVERPRARGDVPDNPY
jgi:serine/threonine-protein kinase